MHSCLLITSGGHPLASHSCWQVLLAAALPGRLGPGLLGWAAARGLGGCLGLGSMGGAITGNIRHGNILPLVLGFMWVYICRTTLWEIFSCHQINLVVCTITVDDICNALKSMDLLGRWGRIVEV